LDGFDVLVMFRPWQSFFGQIGFGVDIVHRRKTQQWVERILVMDIIDQKHRVKLYSVLCVQKRRKHAFITITDEHLMLERVVFQDLGNAAINFIALPQIIIIRKSEGSYIVVDVKSAQQAVIDLPGSLCSKELVRT